MAATTQIKCACGCGKLKTVRVADVKRGWGKYFSKTCKARHQEAKTGQYRNYLRRKEASELDIDEDIHPLSDDNFSFAF